MARQRVDAKTLKERKQKRMAIILTVVFVAMLAFSVPKSISMYKKMNTPAAAPAEEPAAAPVAAAAVPTPDAGAVAVAAASTPTLGGGSGAAPSVGQLVSFGRFVSKDPFVQQIKKDPEVGAGAAAGGAAGDLPAGGLAPDDDVPAAVDGDGSLPDPEDLDDPAADAETGSDDGSTDTGSGTSEPAGPPTSATISVNGGAPETVGEEGTFPALEPIFQVVEVLHTGVKITVVEGNYENGAETITLAVGKPVTLMNTADGTRYEILVVSVGTTAPAAPVAPAP